MANEFTNRLQEELEAKIEYFIREYNLTFGDIIGCLEVIKLTFFTNFFSDGVAMDSEVEFEADDDLELEEEEE